jgi:hypothetical protein
MLVHGRDGERGEDHHEDEDVVHRQRFLDDVAGGYYFNGKVVPDDVYLGLTGCIGSTQTYFTTEFWDAAESFAETNQCAAARIAVSAGQTVSGIDFHLQASGEMLTAKIQTVTHWWSRGVVIAPLGGPHPFVDLRIQAAAQYANMPATIVIATTRQSRLLQGHFLQIDLAAPVVINTTLDAAAAATVTLPPAPGAL